ncbi:LOW QUALITY PROTEIN: olfactory receptor 5G26-like [Chlamydotis macqueenii]
MIPQILESCRSFFVLIYITSLMGNFSTIVLIRFKSLLHTPLYFFLCHLSLVDLGNSSVVAPKTLVSFRKTIPLPGCAAQMCFCGVCVITECHLRATAYGWYVAVCSPLLHMATTSQKVCILAVGCYVVATVSEEVLVGSVFSLHFNVINHFFCDIPPLLKLPCSSTTGAQTVLFTIAALIFVVVSYNCILIAVLRICSSEGRHKACSAFDISLSFFAAMLFMHLHPSCSLDRGKVVSIVHTLVISMLSPLIYSLRNMEVKDALKRLLEDVLISFRNQTGKGVSNYTK